ncbi:DNA replication protein psf2 [Malassezia japonica]|uniref:DNA replication complex GINS protein PSF2 n=1 Tax=Malassezia japonica TaxID=223818 RepID=A0AAF0F225_9BASI|nr:DNA replication protein psf2 [Malassezia japonica]WFD38629.1 DNA replication protein psf2 [Malassezia japonica]
MALPAATQYGILPTEMEYVASSETLIRILPLVSVDRVRLLSGTYGPFRPPAHAEVPLWLALSLRKKRKCVIIPPDWLSVDALTEYVRQETTSLPFAPLPLHYVAIAKLLLEQASEDIPSSSRVRALLKDLREARQSKVLSGLEMVNPAHLEMTNISSLEIAELRPFFATALQQLQAIQAQPQEVSENTEPEHAHADDTDITTHLL